MRRVSQALGVVPMALYKHVSDKEDLVNGMVDAVVSSFPAPPPEVAYAVGSGWRQAVRLRVAGARSALVSHPWLRRTLETRTRRTATVLAHMEAVSAAFLSGGLSPDLTHHAMHALGARIWGFSPELFDESRSGPTPARHTTGARPDTPRLPPRSWRSPPTPRRADPTLPAVTRTSSSPSRSSSSLELLIGCTRPGGHRLTPYPARRDEEPACVGGHSWA